MIIYLTVYSPLLSVIHFQQDAGHRFHKRIAAFETPKRMIRKFCFSLAVLSTALFTMVSAQQTAKVTASGIGYLEYLPQGYHSNSNKYPVVISLHGIKEKGTTSGDRNRILADLAKVDNVGLPKYVNQGKKYPFILISPQLKSNYGTWPGSYVIDVLNHVKKHLRIDERRIYLTGLSLGGFGVWRTAGEYPDVFAAIAPVCPGGNSLNKADDIARANLPIWGFHGSNDRIVSYKVTTRMVNAVNSAPRKPNPLAKATIFPGMGHIIWDKAYQETDVLNWMLRHRKGSAPHDDGRDDDDSGDDDGRNDNDGRDNDGDKGNKDDGNDKDNKNNRGNKKPSVEAGPDRSIVLPTNTLTLAGKASDADGKIVSYHWRKVSGAQSNFNNPYSPTVVANRLQEGTYVFRLTARDNKGAVSYDDVTVVVEKRGNSNRPPKDNGKENKPRNNKPSRKNAVPKVFAGPDRVMKLPNNSVTIRGEANDRDGKIVSYQWEQTYGGRVSFSGANTPTVTISNLQRGVHIFRLRVTDNDGAVRDDYFKITVHAADRNNNRAGRTATENTNSDRSASSERRVSSNARPNAYAGPDRVLDWPRNYLTIGGKAFDKDGEIVAYEWDKTYGKRASITGRETSEVRISNLQPGIYIFRFSATDDDGASKADYFKVTVRDDRS